MTAELRRGYKIHDRLLRPAMVKVAVPAETGAVPRRNGGGGAREAARREGPAL